MHLRVKFVGSRQCRANQGMSEVCKILFTTTEQKTKNLL